MNSRIRSLSLAAAALLLGAWLQGQVRVGADRILEEPYLNWIRGRRVGLITNPTGVNASLQSTRDLLDRHPEVDLVALFGPEHGMRGEAQAGQEVEDREPRIYSLYGRHRAPTPESLRGVEVLLYDIQDVGVRYYTYVSTLFYSMREAARHDIPVVVLDRPNPIGGTRIEGPLLEEGFQSFVGIHTLPVRHGMTVGELAALLNEERELGCDLRVVPLSGWSRHIWYDETGLQWIAPSPNMPTLTTALLYPGLCLIEGTSLSEGRGTTRPFQLLGAPWLKSERLVAELNRLDLPGVIFRVQHFTPTFSKHRGESCAGLEVHIVDRRRFRPLQTALHVLAETARLHPGTFAFRAEAFDRLAGNDWLRQALEQGRPVDAIMDRWRKDLEAFRKRRAKYLLY